MNNRIMCLDFLDINAKDKAVTPKEYCYVSLVLAQFISCKRTLKIAECLFDTTS
jgi:hypothetical protein